MPSKSVRVRFAPSPTGHLHIGGARTALFNWLFARNTGGTFILRIEDTDRTRSTDEYIDSIMEGMRWLNLDWDEGPFRQTDRFDIYNSYADKLLASGHAYHCYCSPEELESRRESAMKQGGKVGYDGRCRNLKTPPPGITPSVRFRVPDTGTVAVSDMIKGVVEFANDQLDDFIIKRSDGTPTYNFVVVCDDVDMNITHVIRGDDHMNNTPRQLHIYRALGKAEPAFGHLPMILGADKARMSKRHGATSVIAYRDMGYLPEALVNYLVRLGWSYGDQEVFTREELIKYFSFESVGKSAAVFNPEKLLWLNAEYIKSSPSERIAKLLLPFLLKSGLIAEGETPDMAWLAKAAHTLRERAKTLPEMAESMRYYFGEAVVMDEKAREKFLTQEAKTILTEIRGLLSGIGDFSAHSLESAVKGFAESKGIKLGNIAQPLRVTVTGGTQSPGIFEVLEALGKERTIKRIDKAVS